MVGLQQKELREAAPPIKTESVDTAAQSSALITQHFGDWSGRRDLNPRPLAPQASALPGCATPRHHG